MKKNHALVTFFCFGICACGDAGTADENIISLLEQRVLPTDEEVLAKAYDNSYQVPDGFYLDERVDTPQSYSVYHVKDASDSFELCTDDYNEAAAWEAEDNSSRSVQGYFTGSHENDRYFEFIRELSFPDGVGNITDPTSPGFARVFKCSYVDRVGVDRNLRDGYAGIINASPLTNQGISTFAEYMWQFTFFWPARKTVLETFSSDLDSSNEHTLVLAFVTNQGTDRCDLIEVIDWVFSADKNSGQLSKSFNLLYRMEAQLVDGTPQKCTD